MLIRLDPASPTSLADQLASALRSSIIDGRLSGGERLPAARTLATELGLNVHTVLRAYHRLRDERLIEVHRGRGAVVAVRIGGHAALAGAVHDLVDEAREHGLPEAALLELVRAAYRSAPQIGVVRPTRPAAPPSTRYS